jgi:CheY-like chemotaxis protein/tetratricopeptide (TPR) repeat protein
MPGRVLYVDDDRSLCQIVEQALTNEGYCVDTAFDGEAALAQISADPPDLVLLDLMLPGLDGFEVLEKIRALDEPERNLPVVLISGCTPTPVYAQRANTLSAVDLLAKPVPLETFVRVVVQQIGEAKSPSPAQVGPSRAAVHRERGFSGTLERIPLPSVLHHLHGMRATGILHLASGKKRKWIQLRDGYPVAVRSNLISETLGHFLVRTGRITQAALEECMQQMGKGKRQGEILIAMEVLSEGEIVEVLHKQADEKLFEAFEWEQGRFRFEQRESLPRANELGLDRSPANVILEGVRSRFPLASIDRFLAQNAACRVAPDENTFNRFQEIALTVCDSALLGRLEGGLCLADLRDEEEHTRRTVYALIAAGILEFDGAAAHRPPQAPLSDGATLQARIAKPPPAASAPRASAGVRSRADDSRRDEERYVALVKLAEELRGKNYFELLGVTQSDEDPALRRGYERLSAQVHPDHFSGASRALRDLADELHAEIKRAFDTLLDTRARQQYLLDERKREREEKDRRKSEIALEAESEFRKGETALDVRDYEAALAHFGRALQLYPHEGDHHAHYGWALYLAHPGDPGMVGEALEHVKRGLKLASHREKPYLFLGRLYKATGRVEMAEKMFTRAVNAQPDCVEALRELRLINMRREKSKGLIGRLLRR